MVTAHSEGGEVADATCPKEAPLAIAGGSVIDEKGGTLLISAPITEHKLSSDGEQPTGWRVRASTGLYTAYAICTSGGKGSPEGEGSAGEAPEGEVKK